MGLTHILLCCIMSSYALVSFRFILGLLCLLVEKGIFKKIKLSFLMVGHTHEDIDQCFSRYIYLLSYIYICKCLPFNELSSSKCLHLPIKTFACVKNLA